MKFWFHKCKFKFKWNFSGEFKFPSNFVWHLGYKKRPCMCIFSTLIIWEVKLKVQTSFEAQNFVLLLFLSLHSSSPTFKLLSMASFGGELLLDSSSPWSGVSSQLFFFSIPLPLKFKKQRTPLMKKIQGLQTPMELHHGFFVLIAWCSEHVILFYFILLLNLSFFCKLEPPCFELKIFMRSFIW